MKAARIRFGMYINGVKVIRTSPVVVDGREGRRITLANGESIVRYVEAFVAGVATRNTIAAGPVTSGWYVSCEGSVVGFGKKKWRGEGGGRRDRHNDLVATGAAFAAYAA